MNMIQQRIIIAESFRRKKLFRVQFAIRLAKLNVSLGWDGAEFIVMSHEDNVIMGQWDNVGRKMRKEGFCLISNLLSRFSNLLLSPLTYFYADEQEIKFPAALIDVIGEIAMEWHKNRSSNIPAKPFL